MTVACHADLDTALGNCSPPKGRRDLSTEVGKPITATVAMQRSIRCKRFPWGVGHTGTSWDSGVEVGIADKYLFSILARPPAYTETMLYRSMDST